MSSNALSVDSRPAASSTETLADKHTITRSDLAEALFRRIGLSRMESAQLVEMVISEISDAIARGENVKLSSFGTFLQRDKRERVGRNPKTGVEARITPRRVLVFRASHIMRARMNGDAD
ncbi:integration host factor subunit alpha [Rhodoblastus acidophilus]|uniref:Integration host factor subunit alpha n=1 Tax=Rhodoblastus acidophilus TaxID=1074 RepID=A0A6N8DUZ5_RHOAC|nr:integration host factor subunit alpha [Rhodoblastus acidophilus]MCW2275991.1 integration host factor subunit alpha [Rhodoblastus acidophilus]MTV32664.1 integration host factor subunit alpha [Rhodoblastus acidophilus]